MAASRTDFWGIELTGKKKEEVWTGEEDEEDENDPDIIHTLHIQRVILGANAKDSEANLLTVTAENPKGEEITHPLAWLNKKSVTEAQCSMHIALPPPVTFKLAQGSGPVHVIGVWEQQIDDDFNFSDEESDGNEMEDDKAMMVPADKIKAIAAPPKAIETKQAKKRPADSPPPKAAKVAKKDESSKKKNLPQFNLPDEDEESDEGEEQESEEDDDNDFDEEGLDEDEEFEEEDESEEEAPPPKIKSKMMKTANAKQKVPAANTPKSIGDKAKKTPKTTPGGPLSFDQLKARLAKSPNVPKKRDKFNNYLQNNLKIADAEMKNKLWSFVQQNKH